MSMQFDMERSGTDHILVASVLLLTGLGLVSLYSASYAFAQRFFGNGLYFVFRQAVFAAVGIVFFFFASVISLEFVRKWIGVLLLATLVVCALTFTGIGIERNGATRWIGFGPISFQPSELVKLVLPLYLAHFFERRKEDIDSLRRAILPSVVISGLFFTLIFFQNNFSTALFLVVNTVFIFILAGIKFRYLFSAVIMFIPIAAFVVVTKEHRLRRLLSYINPEYEPLGAGYQVLSSIRSVSSGGFLGKGIGQGTRKIASVPEIQSDFIFSSYTEETGFLGVILFCALFATFAVRGFAAAMKSENGFHRLLGAGLVSMIISQVLLNIAVVAGALPTTGVPLPFFSAGGSSLVFTMIMAGLIVNISKQPKEKV